MYRYSPFRMGLAIALLACTTGCGGGDPPPPPPPPPPVGVSVAPGTASVFLGVAQQFTATVTNTTNTNVTWTVNGVPGGNATVGIILASGLYTAPQNLPLPANVTVTATSQADPTKSANAAVTIQSDIAVSVTPSAPSVELGAAQQFAPSVAGSGNPNRAVNWTLAGAACGTPAGCGTLSSAGLYTAPQNLPSAAGVTATATSQADPSKSLSVPITLTSSFTLVVTGPGALDNGATGQFTAALTPVAGSNPNPSVTWSVSGAGCAGVACGSITNPASGPATYTAPGIPPVPPSVNITVTSVADAAKAASMAVTINQVVAVSVTPSPTASVALENSQLFTPSVTGTADQRVTWDVNGILGGDQNTVGAITNPGAGPSTYFAPLNMPAPGTIITVRATSQFDPTQSATVAVTLLSNITLAVATVQGSNGSTRAVGRRETVCVGISGTRNPAVVWSVNGITDGDTTVGQIVPPGTSPPPCPALGPSGSIISGMDYLAPASIPASSPVTVTARSVADPAKSGNILITIVANVSVVVLPAATTLPANGTQQFSASVVGSPNQSVAWSLSGANCSGITCGTIDASGLYTAPAAPPAPDNTVTVTATSADGNQAGSATVTIATGAFIRTLLPASVTSGVANSFTLKVQGFNFVAGSGGPASMILFNGGAKSTTCANTTECTATLDAGDVAAAGNRSVQIQNPGPPVQNPNVVWFVVDPLTVTEDVIALTPAAPSATGKDINVVEPTTAGSGAPTLSIDLLGIFQANTCNTGVSVLTFARPAAGSTLVEICIGGNGLTASDTFRLSGPNDIVLGPPQALGGGFVQVRMQLTISSTTERGARTLFVTNANKDKAAATGVIEVK